ncbi:MAG TPA: amino acid adenylation domain-containing protein [Ktedonobacteraceae bacterium]|nr:amino acid adenylation domain-containing protein [Ktedonobacteraceae bacterium]
MYTRDELLKKRASLSQAQLALVQKRIRRESALKIESLPLPKRPQDVQVPLSFAQQRLWFLQQLVPESTAYNELIALNLAGTLNREALGQAMQALVERHEILRTTFPLVEDTVCQVITPTDNLKIEVPLIDLRAMSPAERAAQVHHWTHTQILRPFQLTDEWPWRICILCLGAREHIFLMCMHHCITDAWSLELFVTELMAQYRACCTGQPAALVELPIQYGDYAYWQRQTLTEEKLSKQLDYWLSQLGGTLPVLELPTDHPRPALWTHHGQRQTWHLPEVLYQNLRQWSRQENATLFMVLLAALNVLLYRYTTQEDLIVGTSAAGRPRPELEHVLGCFVNNLALRTSLAGNPSFRELVQRVRKAALDAYENQDLPFEKVVEQLQPVRDLGRNPIFQVALVLQNVPMATVELSDLSVQPVAIETATTRFDLSLILQESSDGIHGYVEYNSDLFEVATIERMMDQYQRVLADAVARPECRVSNLQLLSSFEKQRLLVDWNVTQTESPVQQPIHQQFEVQAARTPEAIALIIDDEYLSYQELNERANQLAHYLRALHVGPEVIVGICMERSLEMIIGILGILKAGGAYVPLDPAYPSERLASLVQATGIQILLAQERLVARLTASSVQLLFLDLNWPYLAPWPRTNIEAQVWPEQLAYVIYTSGSTGQPKGVQILHGNLARLIFARNTAYPEIPTRYLLLSPLVFDASVVGLFWTLSQGGTLVLPSSDFQSNPLLAAHLFERYQISHTLWVPSLYAFLLEQVSAEKFAALRSVIVAGEVCPPSLVEMHQRMVPQALLSNEYGPTEATVWSSVYHCTEVCALPHVPVGRPVAGAQMYLLDRYMQPVPIGASGEIYIGGAGVGRGYLKQADVTAACFIPHPFSTHPGERLYKTGDLARFLPDGTIQFLGRLDDQVKIRGFRIELGEIEATLLHHPALSAALVLAREDIPGDKRLVAYLTLATDSSVSPEELRRFLQDRLPAFMLPSAYIYLERFPLLPTGKIDRRSLPAPEQVPSEPGANFVPARDPVAELVSGIWAQVLRREHIGLYDDFFSLGGHSLLAVQVVSRISATFGVELPLQAFFLDATVSAQAEYVHQALQGTETELVPPLVAVAHDRPLPLSFTQQRQWLLDHLDPEGRISTIFGAVRLSGKLEIPVLERCLREIVRRHALLRTIFLMQSEDLVQIVKPDIALPFNVLDFRTLSKDAQEAEIISLAEREQRWSFDLTQGPLLRMTVARLGEEAHVLMLVCHHMILDGWSMEVFLKELATLYVAFAQGAPSPLPELTVQYADYACWQHELLRGARLERLLTYWKQRLSNLPVLTLPTARTRPMQTTFQAARLPLCLPAFLTEKLKALCLRERVTLYMVLLAAFQATLARYSGQHEIVVGSPTANRNRAELEPVLGSFINTLVLRTDLSGNPTFHEALQRVREVALGAYAHQDLPFEKLIQELHPERDPSRNPLFQVLFAFQNIPEQRISLPGLTPDFLQFGSETTIFDLDLTMWEQEAELVGGLKYSTDLFDEPLIAQMRDDMLALLELMVTNVNLRIADRSLLTSEEQINLLRSWNATGCDYDSEATLHQLFERQVVRTPDALAVIFADQKLTYRQLNRRANQLAHHLRFLGVNAGSMVAILLDRSLEMVPALLAVLKIGGCYVPLEPAFPAAHIQWIISALGISTVITQTSCLSVLAGLTSVEHIICPASVSLYEIEDDLLAALPQVWTRQSLTCCPGTNLSVKVTSNALAYVIFTSGSTGTPKGVMVRHQPVINLIEWVNQTFAITASDRVLFVTSLCFDLSVYDIFGLLAAGGSIQVVANADLHDPERLLDLLLTTPVTFWDSAPALLQTLPLAVCDLSFAGRENLRLVFLSGDWIPIKLPDQVRAAFPLAEVVSLGGATEATIWSNFFRIGEVAPHWVSIPYGKPIQNASYYILDAYLNPCPIGVPGDLYISGACLATGYLGEPELTAQKFLPSPFSEQPGMRLYKTGDLARYWPDGTMEFLGRSDTQVKIRGFRVELGEVEATLTRHPGVQVAVADARRDPSGEKCLVAYVVPRPEQILAVAELRAYLQARLPAYMLPSRFVFLDALPTTANGKLDRRRLAELETQVSQRSEDAYVAPRTPIEEQMAAIWMDVLKLTRLSVQDDFFLVGGHSLLAVQLVARIRSAWQISLPLRDLFAYSTVAGLSERVEVAVRARQTGETLAEIASPASPWYADAVLDPSFPQTIVSVEQRRQPQQIFLTSATGLLGSTLLVELLQRTGAQITCLVRARDADEGFQRIKYALQQDYLWQDAFASRIVPLCGDLTQPLLSLSEATFEHLAQEIDSIYHNGALFSNVLPYEELRNVNVRGVHEVLKLASIAKVKPIHYVSTLGVLSPLASPPGMPLMEVDMLERHRDFMFSSYDKSKWCAESIMQLACERGMPVTIYRPGRLTGHSQTGAWRTDDIVCRQIKGCIQLGSIPGTIFQDQLEMTPVDYVSQAIVTLSLQSHKSGTVFHLLNRAMNVNVERLVTWINDFGYPLEQQSYQVWWSALQQAAEERTGNVLAPFLATYPEPVSEDGSQDVAARIIYDDRQTQLALAGTSISCPPLDRELIHSYLTYFVKSGFLPAPQR